jgi:hypothetical protein
MNRQKWLGQLLCRVGLHCRLQRMAWDWSGYFRPALGDEPAVARRCTCCGKTWEIDP